MKSMLHCNYLVGVLGALLGAMIMRAASAFPMAFTQNGPGSGFWPFSLGAALWFAAALLLVYSVTHKTELKEQEVSLTTAANKRVYILMAMVVVFCVLINLLGFYAAGLLLIPAIMLLMDYKNKIGLALTAVGTMLFIFVVFALILGTKLPESIFLG